MFEQLDLFFANATDDTSKIKRETKSVEKVVENNVEKPKVEIEPIGDNYHPLTPRQHALKRFLEENFVSGKYFTIEEIVELVRDSNGNPYYTLNTNPRTHDKCVALGADIKKINWSIREHYVPIIKDAKGSCKLAESKEEFDSWRNAELEKVEKKYQYLNQLKWKVERDGTVPVVNLNDRALTPEETKVVECYAKTN